MKVFVNDVYENRAFARIESALKKYAPPDFEITDSKEEADLVVLYVFGPRRTVKYAIDHLLADKKRVAVIQTSIRSTSNPSTLDWLPLWQKACLVWSYYDLPTLCEEDKVTPDFNFYHAPLGVDDAFHKIPTEKKYIIATSGMKYYRESVRECIHAAAAINKRVFHVGPVVASRPNVDFSDGMTDAELAKNYSACEFVSGLRRTEGFEFPVVEGLACGARPIVFDRPEAHRWFDGLAVFIPETDRNGIIADLGKVFHKGVVPVTETEIEETKRRFNWEIIIKEFWERCRE